MSSFEEYLSVKDPLTLWNSLSSLWLDAPEVALFKIISELKPCGEKVIYDDIYYISCLKCANAAAISRA
jgi:hypothetical protein